MAYLSIDIGSSVVKVGLIAETGELLGLARRASPLLHGPSGAHESDARLWVDAAASAAREILAGRPEERAASEVRAVSVSGNGPTLLAVDAAGDPLGLALSWMDRRAVTEAEEVSALGQIPVDPSFYLPKALRMWRASAELRERLRWFFSCPEYLLFKLCGEAVTYLPHSGYEPYIWDASLIRTLGLPTERFPPFCGPGTIVGGILEEPAMKFGLRRGTPVVAGYPDFLASIVGSGTVIPALACDRGGTSEALNLCAGRPFAGRELLTLPHAVEGLWNLSGGLSTAGKALEWFAALGGYAPGDASQAIYDEAERSPPGARSLFFLPYLAGERAPLWDSERRAAFVGLSLEHSRADLARALCESIVFGLRLPADIAREAGFPVSAVRTSGGAAHARFLNRLKATVIGVPVETTVVSDCELVGDACASACALGDMGSVAEASAQLARVQDRFDPEPGLTGIYDGIFREYRATIGALAPVDAGLARLRSMPRQG